jgi:hypothetical protein
MSISDLDLRFVFSRTGLASHGAGVCSESFSEPIPLPKGKPLVTLRNAALLSQSFNPGDRYDLHCRTVNPIFTWVRLAQRIPVRIHIDEVPPDVILAAGMTATVEINNRGRASAR